MWKYDGWDSAVKLGIVTPHADIGPEAEFQAMLSALPVTVHGARVDFSAMHPGGKIDEKIAVDPVLDFIRPEVFDRIVGSLSCSPLDAIGLAFTSSSFKIGAERERELLERLKAVSHGIRLETTGTAAVSAIRALNLKRIAVMAPSWFDAQLCQEGQAYFISQDVDVISTTASGPLGGPLRITAETTAEAMTRLVEDTGAEAVFIAGNGQRAIGAIDAIERSLGVTVLTANQVLLWSSLAGSGLRRQISGYGRLFPEAGEG